ncbi:MAG: hypothetical protein IPJ23_09265 [Ignavibacteriales bacterium]|nr:hypothetical protein [Ignavibacteriales bacterium]
MKYFITLFLAVLLNINMFGQTAKYFDAPFGGGGGFVAGWHIPNVDPLNLKLKEIGIPELSKSGIFSTGGGGFIYIGFVKNLRIGGIGFGGSASSSAKIGTDNLEAIYSIGGGALTVEYTLPFIKNIGVSVGASIGAGSMSVELYRNDGSFSWGNIFTEINTGTTSNISRKIINNYWMFTPTLNAEFPVYRFVALRLGLGYQLTFADDWQAENGQSINGVPTDLKSDGFFIQAGIFAGFFSF